MNRMNVNFFICENSFICFVWGLFFLGFAFFSHLLGERAMAAMVGTGEPSLSGLEVRAGSRSLAHSVSHVLFFFQNWDPSC